MTDADTSLWTVADVRAKLPFKVSERELRKRLRRFGRIVEHRNQIAFRPANWDAFLEAWECLGSSGGKARPTGKFTGRALTPESACAKARALIEKTKQKAS